MHVCTYFDRGFLIQGLALARSLLAQEPDSIIWVLALDDFTAKAMTDLGGSRFRVVHVSELEATDPELLAAKQTRSLVEYYFTLSPCFPKWIMDEYPHVDRITYLDADMAFFANPRPIFTAMDAARASVLITAHRFEASLSAHYERHGRYNVGILSFLRDPIGRACLADWRRECLDWCFDRLEADRYADQKYLDRWPARYGASLLVLETPGVNLAPWNWRTAQLSRAADQITAGGSPVILFHFARFRLLRGERLWQSGQLDYGVMPLWLRTAFYTPYVTMLQSARAELAARYAGFNFPGKSGRGGRGFWRSLPLRLLFGGDWLLLGSRFYSTGFGLGSYSGRFLAALRNSFLRRKRT